MTVGYKHYLGDVNLEYGGTFYDVSDVEDGFLCYLTVTDLDSAAGVDNSFLIDRGTVYIDDRDVNRAALACYGYVETIPLCLSVVDYVILLADAVKDYGYANTDDHLLLIWQPDDNDSDDNAPSWGGENCDLVRLNEGVDLLDYLEQEGYLDNFEKENNCD